MRSELILKPFLRTYVVRLREEHRRRHLQRLTPVHTVIQAIPVTRLYILRCGVALEWKVRNHLLIRKFITFGELDHAIK